MSIDWNIYIQEFYTELIENGFPVVIKIKETSHLNPFTQKTEIKWTTYTDEYALFTSAILQEKDNLPVNSGYYGLLLSAINIPSLVKKTPDAVAVDTGTEKFIVESIETIMPGNTPLAYKLVLK